MRRNLFSLCMCVIMAMTWMNFANAASVPQLFETYQGVSARLREHDNKDKRTYARTGPGTEYTLGGGYQPYKQVKVTAYFIENGWVYVRMQYQTQEDRFIYFSKDSFSRLPANLPSVDSFAFYDGVTLDSIIPSWGPGNQYAVHELYQIPAGTPVKAYFQENGYIYAEFLCSDGRVRMWLPSDYVSLGEIIIPTPPVPQPKPTPKPTSKPFPPADGSWSSWRDKPIEEKAGIEVQTRTLYRIKVEIEDWTSWIDGDAEANPGEIGPRVETRVIERDGAEVHQWREYGYHYHYGDWSDWSENVFQSSSTDIIESKTQYRARWVKKN